MTLSSGPLSSIALELARLAGTEVFVETGTYQGATARWAAGHFQQVYTIERAANLFEAHATELRALGNIDTMLGDSRAALARLIPSLQGRRVMFWLDGHWSGGETAGDGDECPLLGELEQIAALPDAIILIDDARLFLSAPPPPHNPAQWPTLVEVIRALSLGGRNPYVQIFDDVIFSVPANSELGHGLQRQAQQRAEIVWQSRTEDARPPGLRRFLRILQ